MKIVIISHSVGFQSVITIVLLKCITSVTRQCDTLSRTSSGK